VSNPLLGGFSPDLADTATAYPPMNEFDLPCSDCGSTLVETHVPVHELVDGSAPTDDVPVADCPTCDARYYLEETIVALATFEPTADSQGDS
jgi:hypothetical protein